MGFLKKLENHLVAPKADAILQLDNQDVALGDNLEGAFTISPREDIVAMEIRCEINCVETLQVMRTEWDAVLKMPVTRQVTERKVLYAAKPLCSSATELVNGLSKSFRFSANIPAGARPTYMAANDSVVWEIKGVVAVHGRPDVTTKDMVFQVILPNQIPVNQPPKVKLIPCQYCQSEMPEDSLACPNCGARRTAQ